MSANINTYLGRVTSEHNKRPLYMAMLGALLQAQVDQQNLLQSFPDIFDLAEPPVGDQLDKLGAWVGVNRNINISGVNLVTNGDFAASAALPPPGWNPTSGVTLSYDTATPLAGARSLVVTSTGSGEANQVGGIAIPGATYAISAWIKTVGGLFASVSFDFIDANGAFISHIAVGTTNPNWTFVQSSGQAPPNAVSLVFTAFNSAAGTAEFGNIVGTGPLIPNLVINGDFEQSSALPPPGWGSVGAMLSYDSTTQESGLRSLIVNAAAEFGTAFQSYSRVVPGATYYFNGWAKANPGITAVIGINFLDASGNIVGVGQASTSNTFWSLIGGACVCPATAVSMDLVLFIETVGGGIAEFDVFLAGSPSAGLPDSTFITLVLLFIAMNTWNGTVPGIYDIWNSILAPTYGQILVEDNQDMSMDVVLLTPPTQILILAILTQGYFLMRPAGVLITGFWEPSLPYPATPIFGFDLENTTIAGFDQGAWMEQISV